MPEITPTKWLTMAGWNDVPHLSEKTKAELLAATPAHLRDARSKGIPALGSGAIFPVDEALITVQPFAIPAHWVQIGGMDFGWDHPTAAARLAWDRDADCIYVMTVYRQAEAQPVIHAAAVKAWGDWLPIAWPHDGNNDTAAGPALAGQYRTLGLKMLKDHATHPPAKGQKEGEGGNSVEAGLMDMLDRMTTGRWKVFSTCDAWFEEFRLYHRKDGKVVKVMDDTLCLHPETLVITRDGARKIVDLVGTNGEVLSIDGAWAPYQNCRKTRVDAPLVRVTFSDGHKLLCTPDHKLLSASGEWVEANTSAGMMCHNAVSSSGDTAWTRSSTKVSDTRASAGTTGAPASSFIGRFGKTITGQFSQGITFITKTRTLKIMRQTISNSCWGEIICPLIKKGTHADLSQHLRHWLNGAKLMPDVTFSTRWARGIITTCTLIANSFARVAEKHLKRGTPAGISFVPTHASQNSADAKAPTLLMRAAFNAAGHSKQTDLSQPSAVRAVATENDGSQPTKVAPTLSVLRVENAGRSDVFCLEVPGLDAFAIANGAVVHNCASRYAYMMRRFAVVQSRPNAISTRDYGVLDRGMGM